MVAVLQNFWWFLVLIGIMIVLHELGHYLMARLFDVKVETFSLGFGPPNSLGPREKKPTSVSVRSLSAATSR